MSITEKCMTFIKVFDATMESSWMTLTAKSDSTLDLLLESPSTGERNFDFKEGVTTAILSHFRGSLETCFNEHYGVPFVSKFEHTSTL